MKNENSENKNLKNQAIFLSNFFSTLNFFFICVSNYFKFLSIQNIKLIFIQDDIIKIMKCDFFIKKSYIAESNLTSH